MLTEKFTTFIGLPQGDPLSPVLFSLFTYDLPACLPHLGPILHGIGIPYIMYADDLAIIAESPEELQAAINALVLYCNVNGLTINARKSQCMMFYKGRPPKCTFNINNTPLELVTNFVYLGFTFTTQLSFSKHLNTVTTKANSRCGILMARLPLKELPLELVLRVFDCYVLPIFRYGLPLWIGSCSEATRRAANSTFTKFIKSYLGIPYHSNNAITHFITQTSPLLDRLECMAPMCLGGLGFPTSLNGYNLSFLNSTIKQKEYDPIPHIPHYFWRSKMFEKLPLSFRNRKTLCREIFDLNHCEICAVEEFHAKVGDGCLCLGCGEQMSQYHQYFCDMFVQ